jgi:DNA-binding CsgD family transcriptional regulator
LAAGGFDRAHVRKALAVLEGRGLLTTGADGVVEVHSPDIALTAFAAEIERNAQRARLNARPLTELFRRARLSHGGTGAAGSPVELRMLESTGEATVALAAVMGEATESLVCLLAPSPRTADFLATEETFPADLTAPDGRRIVHRATFDSGVLEWPGALARLRARAAAGQQIRLTPRVPFTMFIADDSAAIVEFVSPGGEGQGALLARSPILVRALRHFVERRFTEGAPLPSARDQGSAGGFGPRDQLILSLLARGASDTTITRQLDVSQRTVERRIHHILATLGCQSRFQAGVEAARRGLV